MAAKKTTGKQRKQARKKVPRVASSIVGPVVPVRTPPSPPAPVGTTKPKPRRRGSK